MVLDHLPPLHSGDPIYHEARTGGDGSRCYDACVMRSGPASLAAILSCMLFGSAPAFAQSSSNPLLAAASLAKDLELPRETSSFSFFSVPRMSLYKPDGPGPFPALVLQHQCGGLGDGRWQNGSMLDWAKESVKRGYVALLIDSLGPRGVKTVCMGAQGGVNFPRGARDALQAAEHLRKFEFVDKKRIALAGYSWGAMVAALVSGNRWGTSLAAGDRFAVAVSFYPGCFTIKPQAGNPYEILNSDIDRPLLVLMGDKDTEAPASECVRRLEAAKSTGAPVEWHVYPGTTHCWDCKTLDGASKVDVRGNQVVYHYDRKVAEDSARRMFEFLDKTLPRP